MDENYSKILQRLKSYRKAVKLSQTEMGQQFAVNQSHYDKLERGQKIISYRSMMSFLECGGDVGYLITGIKKVPGKMDDYMERFNTTKEQEDLYEIMVWIIRQGLNRSKKSVSDSLPVTMNNIKLMRYRDSFPSIWMNIRKVEGLSQLEMANGLDINIKRYRRIENQQVGPSAEILEILYHKYHYTPLLIMKNQLLYLDEMNMMWESFSEEIRKEMEVLFENVIGLMKRDSD